MPPQRIPQLKRKLDLLMAFGPYADRAALAARIGSRPKTLYWWETGAPGRDPEMVSASGMPKLIDAAAAAFRCLPRDQVLRLLLGPAEDFERYLATEAAPSLRRLLENEADRRKGRIFLQDGSALSLIRTNRPEARPAQAKLRLGQYFRIEFATRHRGTFLLALQASPAGWWIVPSDTDGKGRIHVPGLAEGGTPYLMVEETDAGFHTFVAIQATRAFPGDVLAAAKDGSMLDRAVIAHLVRDLAAQSKANRLILALDLEIGA